MANGSSLRKAVVATTLAVGFVGAVGAADVKELGQIDMSRPIPQGTCVADSASGKAFDKIEAIKKAHGQTNVIEANEVGAKSKVTNSPYAGIYFTSNLSPSSTKGFLGAGYVISSDFPKGQKGTKYCFDYSNEMTLLTSAITGTKVPNTVNKGEIGQALNNAMNRAQSKVGYVAVTSQRTLLAVDFNYKTGQGAYTTADGEGNKYLPLPLVNAEYSLDLPINYQKALGLLPERVAQADQLNRQPQ